ACSIVSGCGCRSVDTRTVNATRIGWSAFVCLWRHRRQRPAQEELVRLIPPRLPIRLLARRPPDLPGASHGCPFPLPSLKRKEYTHGSTVVAGVAATRQAAAGPD